MRQLAVPDDFPLPGMDLALADGDSMHNGSDAAYLAVGLSALSVIERALQGRTPRTILDLPSGYGRVTRVLRARYPDARITVCDLDRPAVDFAAARFKARPAYSQADFRRLALGERYDLIWVGSLVTHLSEAQTLSFLEAMARHATPATTLVITSHGPSIVPGLYDWGYGLEHPGAVSGLLSDYRARRYGHRGYGDGDGYGISLTDRAWWQWAAAKTRLHLVAYSERGWDDHQDVVTLRPHDLRTRLSALLPGRSPRRANPDWGEPPALPPEPPNGRFDPAFYRAANPDVAAAIAAGLFATAYDHYRRCGRAEGRRPTPDP